MAAVAGFNVSALQGQSMQCHYCDREATFAPEKDGVRVGLCDEHFRERFEELSETDALDAIEQEFDADQFE